MEHRRVLAAIPFSTVMLEVSGLSHIVAEAGHGDAVVGLRGNAVVRMNWDANGRLQMRELAQFDAPPRHFVRSNTEGWLVEEGGRLSRLDDRFDRTELLLANLGEPTTIGDSISEARSNALFVGYDDQIMQSDRVGGAWSELRQLVEGDILTMIPVRYSTFQSYGVVYATSVDNGVAVEFIYDVGEPVERLAVLEGASFAELTWTKFNPDVTWDLMIVADTGEAVVIPDLPFWDGSPPDFQPAQTLSSRLSPEWRADLLSTAVADVDGNGLPDLVVSGVRTRQQESFVSWFENQGGRLEEHLLAVQSQPFGKVVVLDVDSNGTQDVVAISESAIVEFRFHQPPAVIWPFEHRGEVGAHRGLDWTPLSVGVADLNSDGILDAVSGGRGVEPLVWFPGAPDGRFLGPKILELTGQGTIHAMTAADFNDDGWADLFYAQEDERFGDIAYFWRENLGGASFSAPRQVGPTNHTLSLSSAVVLAVAQDFDNDGDLDFLTGSHWVENENGVFRESHVITDGRHPSHIAVGDIDLDGDADVVAHLNRPGVRGDVYVYLNDGGSFQPATPLYEDSRLLSGPIALVDLVGDAYPELLWHGQGWMRNEAGELTTDFVWFGAAIGRVDRRATLATDDLDGNGELDVIIADSRLRVGMQVDGRMQWSTLDAFSTDQLSGPPIWDVKIADLNSDGLNDIMIATQTELGLHWYQKMQSGWSERIDVDQHSFSGSLDALSVDIDGDGDLDVVANDNLGRSGWYRNSGDGGQFDAGRLISDWRALAVWDVDSDRDLDVLIADADGFGWLPNLPGTDGFGDVRRIAVDLPRLPPLGRRFVAASGDLDGDVDEDLFVWTNGQLRWLQNQGVDQPFVSHLIDVPRIYGELDLTLADIDADGDNDVVIASSSFSDETSWYQVNYLENAGAGDFTNHVLIYRIVSSENASYWLHAAQVLDFDRDQDFDIVVMSSLGVSWLENLGLGRFSEERQMLGSRALLIADVDVDGDHDFIGGDRWWENTGDNLEFNVQRHDLTFIGSRVRRANTELELPSEIIMSVSVARERQLHGFTNVAKPRVLGDTNRDGLLDAEDLDGLCRDISRGHFATTSDLTGDQRLDQRDVDQLVGALDVVYGDVNFDGRFDSSDLVRLFALGLYGQGPSDAVSWRSGDWNCDGQFSTSDWVAAFSRETYVA